MKEKNEMAAESVSYHYNYLLCLIVLGIRILWFRGLPAGDLLFVICFSKSIKHYFYGKLEKNDKQKYIAAWWALIGFGNLFAYIVELPKYTF